MVNSDATAQKVREWSQTQDFNSYLQERYPPSFVRIILSILLFGAFFLITQHIALLLSALVFLCWGAVKSLRSSLKRWRLKKSIATGEPIVCAVIIANSSALERPGAQAPAAIVGGFCESSEQYFNTISDMALTIGSSYGVSPNDVEPHLKEVCELINDDTYHEARRRKVPSSLLGAEGLYIFDSILEQKHFPDGRIDTPFVTMFAPKNNGPIIHLPPDLVVFEEDDSDGQNGNDYEPNIIKHEMPEKSGFQAPAESIHTEIIESHLISHLGEYDKVFHEIVSEVVHLDIHIVPPRENQQWYTIVTSGMSDLPMSAPQECKEFERAELVMRLPTSWPIDEANFENEENYWPFRIIKMMARMPHELNTWLSFGHTVPLPNASCGGFAGVVLGPPLWASDSFSTAKGLYGNPIHVWSLIPIYQSEMDFKLKHGADLLFERLSEKNIWDLVTPGRSAVC